MALPHVGRTDTRMSGVTAFAGYNHNLRIMDNEFYDMENMTGARLPVASPRRRRAVLRTIEKPNGLFAHEELCWVDGTDFYYGGEIIGTVADSEKQFVRMGAYVLIWPDKVYYNTHTNEYGELEAFAKTSGEVHCQLCRNDGTAYGDYAVQEDPPEEPENGDLWMDISVSPNILRQYSGASSMWTSIPTVYTMITAEGIGKDFETFDGVTIEGFVDGVGDLDGDLNGDYYLIGRGDDYIIITALIVQAFMQTEPVTVARRVPDMDFVFENDNRIWGCSSAAHEIYACALGDPKNWNAFLGLSTDSYAMTVGSGGDFTGACAHLGNMFFFKENIIHQMMGTKPANFQLQSTRSRGVGRGSAKSLCVVNETLFYRSANDVCAFGAALPSGISRPLGEAVYSDAVGGALNGVYYLCMTEGERRVLFTYDTNTGVWCREDETDVRWFATLGGELYFIGASPFHDTEGKGNPEGGALCTVHGGGMDAYGDETATLEPPVSWMLETGDIGLDEPYGKYITGVQLYARAALGVTVTIEVQYDGYGMWAEVYRSAPVQQGSLVLPLASRRCRTLKMRFRGQGDFWLYAITWKTEQGGEKHGSPR